MHARGVIAGIGAYLPQRVMTNADLERMVETSDQWIRERTGITERRITAEGEYTSHMAVHAARAAMTQAGLTASQIDGVVVATSTPDATMPSVASMVQHALGLPHGPALDVQAACTGFVYALSVAQGWLLMGLARHVLVIGAENMSRIVDWSDRGTCILFGDGAGAAVLSASETVGDASRGILSFALHAAGEFGPLLGTNGGVASTQTAGTLAMSGQEVFRHGVDKMSEATLEALAKAGLGLDQVDYVVAHQANARMIQAIARKLSIPMGKMALSLDRHANTSAASIPLALADLVTQNALTPGKIVAMPALGAGLTWGCCIIRW